MKRKYRPTDISEAAVRQKKEEIKDSSFKEMMESSQPLTRVELGRLAKMHPERWGRFKLPRQTL